MMKLGMVNPIAILTAYGLTCWMLGWRKTGHPPPPYAAPLSRWTEESFAQMSDMSEM